MAWILCVDDDPDMLSLMAEVLTRSGHHVLPAPSAEQGLALARSAPVDLVISDVVMPGMDGWQLVEAIRLDDDISELPIILATQLGSSPARLAGLKIGADDYLPKPYEPEELQLRVLRVLHGRKARGRTLPPGKDFSGALTKFNLGSILSVLDMERKTGRLILTETDETCVIGLQDGAVVSARLGGVLDVEGEDAVFIALLWTEGEFAFSSDKQPVAEGMCMRAPELILRAVTNSEHSVQESTGAS